MTMFRCSRTVVSVLAGLTTTASAAFAQAGSAIITGSVKSSQGHGIPAANVRIPELNISVGTGDAGFYRIVIPAERVRGQTVSLSVRAINHKPQTKQIEMVSSVQDHAFTLEFDASRSSEVVVTDARRDTTRTSSSTKQLAFTVDRSGNVYVPAANDPFSQHLFPPELIMQHQARLKLTEQQRDAIIAEINKVQATATQVQWRVGDESEKLAELLRRESVSETEVLAQAERLINQETAVKRAQLSMLIRIRNILTPEQREMLQVRRRGPGPD